MKTSFLLIKKRFVLGFLFMRGYLLSKKKHGINLNFDGKKMLEMKKF